MNCLRLIRGVPKGLTRIGRFGLSEEEVALRKALFLSRRSARIADATVDAHMGVAKFEKMDQKEKAEVWGRFYESAFRSLSRRPEVAADPKLGKQIVFLRNFFALPKRIYEARQRHWRIIQQVERRLTENRIDPKENCLLELERLARRAATANGDIKKFAMDVCIASSIYADMVSRNGKSWSEAYQEGMELAYSKIRGLGRLVEAIVEL